MRYPRRLWNDYTTEVYVADEGRWVSIGEMSEDEFRRFILWRLGIAVTKNSSKAMKAGLEETQRRERLLLEKRVKEAKRPEHK